MFATLKTSHEITEVTVLTGNTCVALYSYCCFVGKSYNKHMSESHFVALLERHGVNIQPITNTIGLQAAGQHGRVNYKIRQIQRRKNLIQDKQQQQLCCCQLQEQQLVTKERHRLCECLHERVIYINICICVSFN